MIPLSPSAAVFLFWAAAIVALGAQAMVLRAALAGRTPAAGSTRGARTRELIWILLPAVALVLVLWATWRTLPRTADSVHPPAGAKALVSEQPVVGGQT